MAPSPPPPDLDDHALLRSLLRLSRDISLSDPPKSLFQKRNISSLHRKSHVLSLFFEELLRGGGVTGISRPAVLCLREILAVLRRFQTLLDNCSSRMSRMRFALQFDRESNEFRELTHELSTLLDIFPLAEIDISDDVKDLVELVRDQCRRPEASAPDPAEEKLRSEILEMVEDIEREIVPRRSRMEDIFEKIGLGDPQSCKDEIARMEVEIRDRSAGSRTGEMIALLGLVRYAKCVLFGASTPRIYAAAAEKVSHCESFSSSDSAAIPEDFRCPISLDLMRDPVVVASGQTYDRDSIQHWINARHTTCPKTGQNMANLHLVPNHALRNLIAQWCRDQHIPFQVKETATPSTSSSSSAKLNKAALEAARMTALYLVQKLSVSPSAEESNRIVHELRQLAKTRSENRAFIAEAGAIPLLLPILDSDDTSLQVNAVTALLNLSILDSNKKRIMKAEGGLDSVVGVLRAGASWHARENAAATLLSLSSLHSVYRRRVGRERGVAEGLAELVATGPTSSKRDGLITMLNLAGVRENIDRLVEGGVVEAALKATRNNDVAEMAVAVLAAVAKRGGSRAVGEAEGFVERMVGIFRLGTGLAKEAAAAALVSVCRMGGSGPVAELAATPGIEFIIWGLLGSGSERARRKAASLGRICRRWAASKEVDRTVGLSSLSILTSAQS